MCNSSSQLKQIQNALCKELDKRVSDKILEQTNADLLKELINKVDDPRKAQAIAELGTTYKRTGLHFDKRLEKTGSYIKYLKKNEKLSFTTDEKALTHKFIIGDNYDALLNLLITHKKSIDVIYIDPPYGKDDMGQFADTNYDNAITRDNLLSMLYPRLQLAKMLLTDKGVIFCSIDDKNQAYVKCLFDEVFGDNNFIANQIWKCRNSLYYTEPLISIQTEYILSYAKNKSEFSLTAFDKDNINGDDEKVLNGFFFNRIRKKHDDEDYINPINDPRGAFKTSGKVRNDGRPKYSVTSPTGVQHTEAWVYTQELFEKLDKDNQIYWGVDGSAQPRKKSYLKDFIGNVPSNIVFDEFVRTVQTDGKIKKEKTFEVGTTEQGTSDLKGIIPTKAFPYPKPVALIKYQIMLYPQKDITVLDFFAGSGTTGQAVLDLNREDGGNRQFILVTNNEKTESTPNGIAYDVTSKRLKRVMSGECYDGNKDFEWIKKNEPYGDNLEVVDIAEVNQSENKEGESPFDVIDETLYGLHKFTNLNDKIKWVCDNFSLTTKTIESQEAYDVRRNN